MQHSFSCITCKSSPQERLEKDTTVELNASSLKMIRDLLVIITYLFSTTPDYKADFKMAVSTSLGGSQNSNGLGHRSDETNIQFWCLNPAAVFTELASQTRSVILTR